MNVFLKFTKPTTKYYILKERSDSDYDAIARKYAKAKRYGWRACATVLYGSGVKDIAFEVAKGTVRTWGREKIGSVIISSAIYVCAPAVKFITNSTKLIGIAKRAHNCAAFTFEVVEDSANICWAPLDMIVFGQLIPIGDQGRFSFFGNWTDISGS